MEGAEGQSYGLIPDWCGVGEETCPSASWDVLPVYDVIGIPTWRECHTQLKTLPSLVPRTTRALLWPIYVARQDIKKHIQLNKSTRRFS